MRSIVTGRTKSFFHFVHPRIGDKFHYFVEGVLGANSCRSLRCSSREDATTIVDVAISRALFTLQYLSHFSNIYIIYIYQIIYIIYIFLLKQWAHVISIGVLPASVLYRVETRFLGSLDIQDRLKQSTSTSCFLFPFLNPSAKTILKPPLI